MDPAARLFKTVAACLKYRANYEPDLTFKKPLLHLVRPLGDNLLATSLRLDLLVHQIAVRSESFRLRQDAFRYVAEPLEVGRPVVIPEPIQELVAEVGLVPLDFLTRQRCSLAAGPAAIIKQQVKGIESSWNSFHSSILLALSAYSFVTASFAK